MKKITLMLFAFLIGFHGFSQVTIGAETATTTNLPITSCYGYTYSEQIFLASEINASGDITSISFYLDAATSTTDFSDSVGWTIYLGNTTKNDYTSTTDWITSTGLTQVYTGDIAFPAEDNWVTITLDTPFTYDGIDNLVVAIDENTDSFNCSMYWRRSSTTDAKSIYYRSDGTNPDPTSPPTATGTLSFRANTIFGGIAQACPSPSDLTAINVTTTTADLGWTENGTASLYNVEVVTAGDAPTGTATDSGVANGFTKTGLSPNVSYEFFVQSDCTGGDVSSWVGPFEFTTPCTIYTPDYLESFDTFVPNCWIEAGSGDPTTGPSDLGTGFWNHTDFVNAGGADNSAKINLYTNNREDWLLSPSFDLSGGTYELVFTAAITDYNNSNVPELNGMGSDDEVQVLISEDDGVTWANLLTYNQSSFPSNTGDQETIDLAAYTGTVQFAIWATDGSVNDSEDYDFFIDEFIVRVPPTCIPPTATFTVVEDCTNGFSVDIDVTDLGNAASYDVQSDGNTVGTISATGITTVGPFTNGTPVDLTILYPADSVCDITETNLVNPTLCPIEVVCGTASNISGVCYSSGNLEEWLFTSADGVSLLNITVNAGEVENNWDEFKVYDGTDATAPELYNGYGNSGDLTGLTFNSSGTSLYIQITPDGTVDCGTEGYVNLDFDVNCYVPCTADAGTLTADATPVTLTGGTATISATEDTAPTIPTDYEVTYVLTFGPTLIIEDAGATPSFDVTTPGDYIIHTLVAETTDATDPNYVDLSLITFGTTTAADVLALFASSGITCVALDVNGAPITVLEECTADAGTLTADATPVTLTGGIATISATEDTAPTVPTDYEVTYVLTFGPTLIIEDAGATPSFDVTTPGDYIIHTLVAETTDATDPNYVDLSLISFGTTTVSDILVLLAGSGVSCVALDFAGAPITVEENLSVGDANDQAAFSYYPNPVKNILKLKAQNNIENVEMYNMLGQVVLRATPNTLESDLDMSSLQTGTYFVKVTIESISKTIRVIKE